MPALLRCLPLYFSGLETTLDFDILNSCEKSKFRYLEFSQNWNV